MKSEKKVMKNTGISRSVPVDMGLESHIITIEQIRYAHDEFKKNEPRDLFYKAATDLIALSQRGETSLTVAEALAVLLQTWNKAYYRFRKFDENHFRNIEELLSKNHKVFEEVKERSIESLNTEEKNRIVNLFQSFEKVLGPVGAAKALHLLAPRLFPLWDRAIAKEYDVNLGESGFNGEGYWRFMLISQKQYSELKHVRSEFPNLLKSIEEYNYFKFTKGWLD